MEEGNPYELKSENPNESNGEYLLKRFRDFTFSFLEDLMRVFLWILWPLIPLPWYHASGTQEKENIRVTTVTKNEENYVVDFTTHWKKSGS